MAYGKPRRRKPGERRSEWKRTKRSDLKGGFMTRHAMKKAAEKAAKRAAKKSSSES